MHAFAILLCSMLALGCGAGAGATIQRPHAESRRAPEVSRGEAPLLARAFEQRLTVWTRRDGERVLARHCRRGPVDCRARLSAFASMLASAARDHALDPFLLGALAVHESMLNPAALGARGEAGIVQLHPRGVGRDVPYVQDAALRERCQGQVDACQGPVVERAASALAESIRRCGGLDGGLARYASGRCGAGLAQARGVLEERDRLRALID